MKDDRGYHKIKGRERSPCWWDKDMDKQDTVFIQGRTTNLTVLTTEALSMQ